MRRLIRRLACSVVLLATPVFASEPRFWTLESASDFLAGDASGTAVDSEGHLRLALASRLLHDPETASIWSLARDRSGVTYAGTGDDGVVVRVEGERGNSLYDAESPHVYAVAIAPDGRLHAAHSPDGRVVALSAAGTAQPVFDPSERYIWAIAFDSQGRLLVATGSAGRVYRVDGEGNATTLLESGEGHVTALVAADDGTVYAGSAPSGIIYRIDPQDAVFALHDSSYQEVKALALGAGGRLYAAMVGGSGATAAPSQPQPQSTPSATATSSQATVTVEVTATAVAAPAPAQPAAGAVLLLQPGGSVESLWSSSEDAPHSLLTIDDGVLVGTGNQAKLFRVRDDRSWVMERSFPAAQITALARGGDGTVVLATSNPGRVFELSESGAEEEGHWISKVHDSGMPARWGRLSWEAEVAPGSVVTLQTRSGNTAQPDATWSEWSTPAADPRQARVASEEARFLQVRANLQGSAGATPRVRVVRTAYLQRNRRPQVAAITVHPPGAVFQKPLMVGSEPELLGLAAGDVTAAAAAAPGGDAAQASLLSGLGRPLFRRGLQTISWSASDPNGDALEYDVLFRAAEGDDFRPLRTGLEEEVLAWDTSAVPDGRYVLKVRASDRRDNPPELALLGEQESGSFQVDNTPPLISLQPRPDAPGSVRVEARDASSALLRLDYAIDAGRWIEVHPEDGISDSSEESYSIRPRLDDGTTHVLVVRAIDRHGNSASAMIELPAR